MPLGYMYDDGNSTVFVGNRWFDGETSGGNGAGVSPWNRPQPDRMACGPQYFSTIDVRWELMIFKQSIECSWFRIFAIDSRGGHHGRRLSC